MPMSRRQFLKGLFGTGAVLATGAVAYRVSKNSKKPLPDLNPKLEIADETQLLMDSYFPLLKLNEGENFSFYRCARKKVSVGYGTNFEANPHWFRDIPLYYKGKKLSQKEAINVYTKMTKMSDEELENYTIQPQDARALADKGMKFFIGKLQDQIQNPKTKESVFFELPLCMQALALDVMYNVGVGYYSEKEKKHKGFMAYKKFKAALLSRDFETAMKESKVYVDKNAKTVNLNRERRKKRLYRVMKIVQANKNNLNMIPQLICQDYDATVPAVSIRKRWGIPYPYFEKALNRDPDLTCELSMAQGEYCHIKLYQKRALEAIKSKSTEKKVAQTSQKRMAVLGKKRQAER